MKQDPTLYEPKSMFCEIGSLIGPAIGVVGSLIGGSQAAGAAEEASDAQVRAAEVAAGVSREALGFQREMYDVGRSDLAPYRASGAGALQTMNNMFLPGGHSMVQMQGQLNELRAQRARLMSAPAAPPPAIPPAIQRASIQSSGGGRVLVREGREGGSDESRAEREGRGGGRDADRDRGGESGESDPGGTGFRG